MKKIIIFALTAATLCAALAAPAQTPSGKLALKLSGINSNQGNIMVGIGDYKTSLQSMAGKIVPCDTAALTIVFDSLQLGTQNIYICHDVNKNFNMDYPDEGYGVRKGTKAYEIKADITANDQTIEVEMLYPNKK